MNAPAFQMAARIASGWPRAQDIDRHIGLRLRQLRVVNGLTQQKLADMIGVTCQQAHKYETGTNRIAAAKLHAIAQAFGVEVRYFFEGLQAPAPNQLTVQQRVFLDLARNFRAIQRPEHQETICLLARVLANVENGSDASVGHGPEIGETARRQT